MNRELLAAVLAETDSDEPRLVYSDWLEEHGQADRAEFIRVQCERARFWVRGNPFSEAEDSRLDILRRRERELLSHSECWPELHALIGTGLLFGLHRPEAWRRGFVEHVTCTAADWCAHADALLAAQPMREVTLTTWPEVEAVEGNFADGRWQQFWARLPGRKKLHEAFTPVPRMLAAEWPQIRIWTLPGVGIAKPETSL